MLPPDENNTRYHLELSREDLIRQRDDFDRKYGTFAFAFLTSIESFALLAYILIATTSLKYKKSKTHCMVAIWAVLNFFALLEKTTRSFTEMALSFEASQTFAVLGEMTAASSRNYGTFLYIVWFVTRYCPKPKPKYDLFLYALMFVPVLVSSSFILYYFFVDEYVYQYYTPGSDIVNVVTYFTVSLLFIVCQIANEVRFSHNHYTFLVSIINLVTNFPICLTAVYLRFVLDISWVYRFHIYFVDFLLDIIACSNSFIILFLTIMYNDKVKKKLVGEKKDALLEKIVI